MMRFTNIVREWSGIQNEINDRNDEHTSSQPLHIWRSRTELCMGRISYLTSRPAHRHTRAQCLCFGKEGDVGLVLFAWYDSCEAFNLFCCVSVWLCACACVCVCACVCYPHIDCSVASASIVVPTSTLLPILATRPASSRSLRLLNNRWFHQSIGPGKE